MKPTDIIGKSVSFDHHGSRLVGTATAAKDNGKTARGAIPDLLVTVQGSTGKQVTVSFVESYMRVSNPYRP